MCCCLQKIEKNISDEIILCLLFYVTFLAMHVAVSCSFFLFFYCKLDIKVKLEDSQLCADCLPCISFSFDILVGFQAVVNTTPGILAPNLSPSHC